MKHEKRTAGFTLVELIVVIAVMGILAGVGTVGYGGYVKSAAKKADLVTVGNVEKALDIGVYSSSFVLPEALQLCSDGITFPVGFVVLTENNDGSQGVQLLSTGSTYSTGTQTNECSKATVEVVTSYTKTHYHNDMSVLERVLSFIGAAPPEDYDVYTNIVTQPVDYCATHTLLSPQTEVYTGSEHISKWYGTYDKPTTSQNYIFESDCVGIYSLIKDHTYGEHRETTEITEGGSNVNNTVLQDALTAAYGEAWDDVALQYGGWTSQTSASFYTDASAIFDTIDTKLSTAVSLPSALQKKALSKSYESTDDLAVNVANRVSSIGEEAWVRNWEETDNSTADSDEFRNADFGVAGGNNNGREFYSAARALYNSCFAEYLKNNGHDVHASAVEEFSSPVEVSGFEVDIGLPAAICRSAFAKGESNLADEVKNCDTCKALYETYVSSGASRENAIATFKTMKSVSETVEEIDKTGGYDAADFFDYYNKYLDEFSGLYANVNTLTRDRSAIVITVYYKDGVVSYDVSPSEANPRK